MAVHLPSLLRLVSVAVAAACGEPNAPQDDDGPDPTPPTEDTYDEDGPCASGDVLFGTLGTCDDAFPSCGGDLTGTWVVDEWCSYGDTTGTITYTGLNCSDDVVQRTTSAAATVNFGADGTFQVVSALDLEIQWTVPTVCLEELGHADCAALAMAYAEYYGLSCAAEATGGCTCVAEGHVTFQGESTWTACDGRLVIDDVSGTVDGTLYGFPYTGTTDVGPLETDYCIDGDLLRVESDPFDFGGVYRRP